MFEDRFMYRGQDVTLDVTIKIEQVVTIIAQVRGQAFDDAYASLVASRTYEAVQDPESLMWAESAQYIADRFFEEEPPGERRPPASQA